MKHKIILTAFVLAFFSSNSQNACTDPQALNYNSSATINDGSCTYPQTAQSVQSKGTLMPYVSESSGLILSDGFIWTHNDSGNSAKFYKVDTANGSVLQTISISNYPNVDWEDISADSAYIYLGDCGDNNGTRTDLKILRVNKSQFITSTLSTITATAEAINFSYADQTSFVSSSTHNFDCESVMALGNFLYLFTKDRGDLQTRVYKLSKLPGTYTLSPYTTFNTGGLVTGADYHKQTNEVALIGYLPSHKNSFLYFLNDFTGDLFFSGNKRRIEIGNDINDWQTEGITYAGTNELFLSCESSYTPATLYSTSKTTMRLTGISELSSEWTGTKIYPNPAGALLHIASSVNLQKIELCTVVGQILLCLSPHENEVSLNISQFDAGVYYLRLWTEQGNLTTEKLIISRP